MLATQYESVHEIDVNNVTDEQENIVQENIVQIVKKILNKEKTKDFLDYFTNPREIKEIINVISSKKAPGIDHVQNIVLKNASKKSLVQLMYIINASITLSYFPSH